MLLSSLLLVPLLGVFVILINKDNEVSSRNIKFIALTATTLNLFLSLIIFILFDFSTNQFQFVQEYHEISYFDFYLGIDGLSIYFILLTTIIMPISLLSNWTSISKDVESYVIIILLLETLLLAVFLVLDILLFYIFFESILPPLFILIGIFGSDNRVKASFYLFLYTLLGSLFLLLSILAMSSIMSTTDFDTLFKGNFIYLTQLFLFYGIFIAFAVKTPTIFLNTWLLKAHVESPLGGSIILAAIVLKLSLYGILRLILPVLPKAYMEYTYIIYLIGVITIIYASLSTLRTIDVKELIAYSSVSHAAVYLLAVFSNNIQGIEGGINLGLAHGLVSPGLFICAGGVLYDRSHTRLISFYKGMAQIMPLFAILFFILCLANCGAPLTLNFIGEFMSLYGVFERSSLFGVFASSSIVFSAAYTIYMYQRISFGGSYSRMFTVNIIDLNKREFMILLSLVVPTVVFGVYTAPILDGIHYSVSTLIYSFDNNVINCDAPTSWGIPFNHTYVLNSSCTNDIYGLVVMLVFFSVLFELGKNALSIESKQTSISNNDDIPKPHAFTNNLLVSGLFHNDLTKRADALTDKALSVENAEELKSKAGNNPEAVRQEADKQIESLEREKNTLLGDIQSRRATSSDPSDHRALDSLTKQVNDDSRVGVSDIKEASNEAVNLIDDSDATAHLLFNALPVFFINYTAFAIIKLLIVCFFDKPLKLYFSIHYHALKNKIIFFYGIVCIVILLILGYYLLLCI